MGKILSPTTGIILTAMNSGMTHIDAVAEFVDNSFGVASGNANEITIIDAGDAMMFQDSGNGVEDIDKMFTLGDGNNRNSSDDIGRFGVGSKFGALTFGSDVTVHTVRDGFYKVHNVDWEKVLDTGNWPRGFDGEGLPASKAPKQIANGGTIVVVKNLKDNRRPFTETYAKRLGMRFMPWLEAGKDIKFLRANSSKAAASGKYYEEVSIRERFSQYLKGRLINVKSAEGEVNGKKFKVMYGVLPNGDKDLNGIHINFAGRTIEAVQTGLPNQKIPSKYFARVDLSSDWKTSLNYNKTVVVTDRDELLAAVEKLTKSLLDKLAADDQQQMFEKLGAEISNMLHPNVGTMIKKAIDGEEEATDEGIFVDFEDLEENPDKPDPDDPDNPNPNPEVAPPEKDLKPGKGKRREGAFKFVLNCGHFGKEFSPVKATLELTDKSGKCIVDLNMDYPIIKKAVDRQPGNAPATFLLAIKGLSDVLAKDEVAATKMLGVKFMTDLESATREVDIALSIYDKLMALSIDGDK